MSYTAEQVRATVLVLNDRMPSNHPAIKQLEAFADMLDAAEQASPSTGSNLDMLLAHCNGVDCICFAGYSGECACDADWTPAEVYLLRAERDALQTRIEMK